MMENTHLMEECPDTSTRFDPRKGYEPDRQIEEYEVARNAYYQGYVTDWEYKQLIKEDYFIDDKGILKSLRGMHTSEKGELTIMHTAILTLDRMSMIQAKHLLGVGDGRTSFDPEGT
jgi:hypothetical protein